MIEHEPCASRGDCYHSRGGREVGRKNVESGQIARMNELPQTKAARRENGRKAVESGRLARMNELPQTKAARRENGRKKVESGELARMRSDRVIQAKIAKRLSEHPNGLEKDAMRLLADPRTSHYQFNIHVPPVPGSRDFVYEKERVIVEMDGDAWHYRTAQQREKTNKVTERLVEAGWLVLRISESEFEEHPESLVPSVVEALKFFKVLS